MRRLLNALTYFDAEGDEIVAYDYNERKGELRIPRGALNLMPSHVSVTDMRCLPQMPKLGYAKQLDAEGFEGQRDAVLAMFKAGQGQVIAPPARGKALALDTLLPTPDGWTTMGEVKTGDQLLDENGRPCEVVYATEPYLGRCFKVHFSDGSWIVADGDHRWLTWDRGARLYERSLDPSLTKKQPVRWPEVRTTDEIADSLYRGDGALNHSIKNAEPLALQAKRLPIPPYLLGAWLGDGSSYRAEITTMEPEVVRAFGAKYRLTQRTHQSSGRATTYGVVGGLHRALLDLGLYRKKHIPLMYRRASRRQRLALLRGLMDTDGGWTSGQCEIAVSNKRLAEHIYELVVSLGMSARLSARIPSQNGTPGKKSYRVKFTPIAQCFTVHYKASQYRARRSQLHRRTHRYIVAVEPVRSRMVRCIQVSSASSLYLAGRQMVPTHNTEIGLAFAASAKTRTLILVHTRDLFKQWEDRARSSLPNASVGKIQGQLCQIEHVTIAMAQTLRNYVTADGQFWRQFGCIIVDEGHHAAAETWEWLLNVSPAYYRFGLTATDKRADGRQMSVGFNIGPVIYRIKFKSQVPLMVIPVETGFRSCWGANQWSRLMRHLAANEDRNAKIAQVAVREYQEGNTVLVLSRQIKHLEHIYDHISLALGFDQGDLQRVSLFTGRGLTQRKRDELMTAFRAGDLRLVLATQIADEGLDVTRLNRVLLTFPGKHDGRIIQQIGRSIRKHPGKVDAKVYDFVDDLVPVLGRQYLQRKRTYKQLGLQIGRAERRHNADKNKKRIVPHLLEVRRSRRD